MRNIGENEQRTALAGWEQDGGAPPSAGGLGAERQRDQGFAQAATLGAFDETHQSSVRGEHRYPDAHQTAAERKARSDRDALKLKLGATR